MNWFKKATIWSTTMWIEQWQYSSIFCAPNTILSYCNKIACTRLGFQQSHIYHKCLNHPAIYRICLSSNAHEAKTYSHSSSLLYSDHIIWWDTKRSAYCLVQWFSVPNDGTSCAVLFTFRGLRASAFHQTVCCLYLKSPKTPAWKP